jgi:hypothetical protein
VDIQDEIKSRTGLTDFSIAMNMRRGLAPASESSASVPESPPQSTPAGTGLTAVALRNLPLGRLVDGQAQALSILASGDQRSGVEILRPGRAPIRLSLSPEHRKATRYLGDALTYVLAVRSGDRTPALTLAERTGRPLPTVRTRLATARRLGLLTSEGAGATGGRLTPLAIKLLRESAAVADSEFAEQLDQLADELED